MKQICLVILSFISTLATAQTFNIGERTLTYFDSSRSRPIKIEIWYPTLEKDQLKERNTELPFILPATIRNAAFIQNKSFPLVLLSHGTGGNRFGLSWLANSLAKNGYMVIAPDHFGNSLDTKIPAYFARYWERPLDISFLITTLTNDNFIKNIIDFKKISMVGFSLGGYTTLALAGADLNCEFIKRQVNLEKDFSVPEIGNLKSFYAQIHCDSLQKSYKDARIKVFVAMSPALGLGYKDSTQMNVKSPLLIIGAENDSITPLKYNAEKYHRLIKNSKYEVIKGKVGHYIFLPQIKEFSEETKIYFADDKSINRQAIHDKITKDVLLFLHQNLAN